MNKIAIPALLVATVMIAGAFAFVPVEQASTTHTSAGNSTVETLTFTDTDVTEDTDVYTLTCTGDALVQAVRVQQLPADDGTATDLTIAFGSTDAGAAGIAAAADADAAISLAVVNNIALETGNVLTATAGGTVETTDGDLNIVSVVERAGNTVCAWTETA